MKRILLLPIYLGIFLVTASVQANIVYPDFTTSMLRDGRSLYMFERTFVRKQLRGDFSNSRWLDLFRYLYARNIVLIKDSGLGHEYRIPPIVHQIWLGSPPPEKYREWMTTWMNWHGWTYRLWTDEDVRCRELYNQELYDRADNYGEKSDILRLEILLEHGGMYVDVDFECIRPDIFDALHRTWDFYIGFEPLEHGLLDGYDMFKFCNALIGAAPGHPIVQKLITDLKSNYIACKHLWTVEKTGPAYVTRTIFTYEANNPRHGYLNAYLPASFFYPFSEPEARQLLHFEDDTLLFAPPETAAIHYWGHSWEQPNQVCGNLMFDRKLRQLVRRQESDLINLP